MDRRGRAGEVVDLVDFDIEREGDVVPHRLEVRLLQQMRDIVFAAGEIVVGAQDVVSPRGQALAQMRAEKPGAAGDEDPLLYRLHGIVLVVLRLAAGQPITRRLGATVAPGAAAPGAAASPPAGLLGRPML